MKASLVKLLSPVAAMALFAITTNIAASFIDSGKSQITATFRQMNVPVEGRFTGISGNIVFNPKRPATAQARIEVDTASFDVGAPEYNDELRAKEWLDSSIYPKASFISTRVIAIGPNRFEASGKFSLKGKTSETKIPFTQRLEGNIWIYEGEFPLSRKFYSIGGPAWDKTVDDQVVVRFRIVTIPKQSNPK